MIVMSPSCELDHRDLPHPVSYGHVLTRDQYAQLLNFGVANGGPVLGLDQVEQP